MINRSPRLMSFFVILSLSFFAFSLASCGSTPSIPQQAEVATSGADQQKYSVQVIYDEALEYSSNIVESQMKSRAFLTALGWALFILAAGILITGFHPLGCGIVILMSFAAFFWARSGVTSQIPETVDRLSHEYANFALNDGVDRAQKLQASNEQYIAATFTGFGEYRMACTTTVNHKSDCNANSSYYSTRDVNCTTWEDDDGNEHESCDTEYSPWFPYLRIDYGVVATKAKYLDQRIYSFKCVNPDTLSLETCTRDDGGLVNDRRNPAVFLHTDWRAPKDGQTLPGVWAGSFVNSTPQLWADLENAQRLANAGQPSPTITGYFTGTYFHWNLAAGSPDVVVLDGPYNRLQQLVDLPKPDGNWFNYVDALGRNVSMETLLFSNDGDLATKLNPVFFIGFDQVPTTLSDEMNKIGQEFQGAYGPGKQSINYTVIINEETVEEMGGILETTTALMGWLQDESRWGLFRIPKNQTLVVVVASSDLSSFDQLNFETGLPWGNTVIKQDIRMSVESPQALNWTSLMGTVESTYLPAEIREYGVSWAVQMGYEFLDMTQADGVIGLLYENELAIYADKFASPDPNSEECQTAQPEHPGYVRYQMCTQQFLQTTIQINEDGKALIMKDVNQLSQNAVNNSGKITAVFFWIITLFLVAGFRARMSGNF